MVMIPTLRRKLSHLICLNLSHGDLNALVRLTSLAAGQGWRGPGRFVIQYVRIRNQESLRKWSLSAANAVE